MFDKNSISGSESLCKGASAPLYPQKRGDIVMYTPSLEDQERFDNQKMAVLSHLQEGKTITQDEGNALYGIMRLAARISELRREGWNIVTTMIPAGENGAPVAQYTLASEPRRTTPFLPVSYENIPDELKALPQWVLWRGMPSTVTKTNFSIMINLKANVEGLIMRKRQLIGNLPLPTREAS
ncbi:MAG: hypothetical protein LBQ90_12275 [Synergistaceae bacterium]|jgi:hypothetical protein|nr:hypothetical protein [Synergistaceae bacterium]